MPMDSKELKALSDRMLDDVAAEESLSLQAGVDYNHGSKVPNSEIRHPVNEVNRSDGLHRKPDKGNPNSVHIDYRGGDSINV